MSARFARPRGFHDILPGESDRWQSFERRARELLRRYGFREIRPPMLELTELFTRSVGEGTDIVGKEMFTLDAGEESLTLRPEITASVCRAFVEHSLHREAENRLYYIGPAFRKERPQKGRLRQFHQIGTELFGEAAAGADVETIAIAWEIVRAAEVRGPELVINSLGDLTTRASYRAALVEFLSACADQLDDESRARISRNPLRVLDSKDERTQRAIASAPTLLDYLDDDARRHFEAVQNGLAAIGIPFRVDPKLVRGLDYYVRTTFEVTADTGGSQNAVLGGGRYDNLIADLGGPAVPGVGFAAGIERLFLAAADGSTPTAAIELFVVTLGDAAGAHALPLVQQLRAAGFATLWDPAGRGLSAQMKRAGRSGARFALILGDDELTQKNVKLRDLTAGHETQAPLEIGALVAQLVQCGARQGAS